MSNTSDTTTTTPADDPNLDAAGDKLNHPRLTEDDCKARRFWLAICRSDGDSKSVDQDWEWFDHIDAAHDYIDNWTLDVKAMSSGGELLGGVWFTALFDCGAKKAEFHQPHLMPGDGVRVQVGLRDNQIHAFVQRITPRFREDILLGWTLAQYKAMGPAAKVTAKKEVKVAPGLAKQKGIAAAKASRATPPPPPAKVPAKRAPAAKPATAKPAKPAKSPATPAKVVATDKTAAMKKMRRPAAAAQGAPAALTGTVTKAAAMKAVRAAKAAEARAAK